MKKIRILTISLCLLLLPVTSHAWDGFDYNNGSFVEIDKGNLVRPGHEIEVFDYQTGRYHDVTVDSIRQFGSDVEVEVYDNTTGEYRTLNMDDN